MAEKVDLTVAYGTTTNEWRVMSLVLELGMKPDLSYDQDRSFIQVIFVGLNGHRLMHTWRGAGAHADIIALNKANLTTNSLQKRIFTKALNDGVFAGTISGTAD